MADNGTLCDDCKRTIHGPSAKTPAGDELCVECNEYREGKGHDFDARPAFVAAASHSKSVDSRPTLTAEETTERSKSEALWT